MVKVDISTGEDKTFGHSGDILNTRLIPDGA